MKKIYIFVLLVCLVGFGKSNAQINLVPNPSFEQDTACPDQISQIYKLKNWFTVNATPDYYNRCYYGVSNNANIPLNSLGFQDINTLCHSYIGINNSLPGNLDNIANEIVCVKLNDSLIKNIKYFFSCNVSLSNNSKFATNNIGAFFSNLQPPLTNTRTPSNFSQIKFTQIVIDTLNWIKLKGSFTADSNYKYVSIGNFYDSTSTTKLNVNNSGFPYSYYYIDNVCLSTDSAFVFNYVFNCSTVSIIENLVFDQIKIYPNPVSNILHIDNLCADYTYKIYDFTGKEISNTMSNYLTNSIIDISNYDDGIYTLKIFNGTKYIIKTQKLLIIKP